MPKLVRERFYVIRVSLIVHQYVRIQLCIHRHTECSPPLSLSHIRVNPLFIKKSFRTIRKLGTEAAIRIENNLFPRLKIYFFTRCF